SAMNQSDWPVARSFLSEIWDGLGGDVSYLDRVRFDGIGEVQSPFALTDFAAGTFAAAGLAIAELVEAVGAAVPDVRVDRVGSSAWFHLPPPPGHPVAGRTPTPPSFGPWSPPFRTADGRWLRVQAGYDTQRHRLVKALDVPEDRAEAERVVAQYKAEEIEEFLVGHGVAAATSRTTDEWLDHPAGKAVAAEPIVATTITPSSETGWTPTPGRPLGGIKVLDLTRVVSGPTGTRFLGALGAEVLRLDLPGSEESSAPMGGRSELMQGKRMAFLDLRTPEGLSQFKRLLAEADVFVHGYRPGGIDGLISEAERRAIKPNLVEVALNAYGWEGPWSMRRGFDTIVQWSSGMCAATQAWALANPERRLPLQQHIGPPVDASVPRHLVIEALDVGAGYQIAAAAIRGLTRRLTTGAGSRSRLSLARTAISLINKGQIVEDTEWVKLPLDGPYEDRVYYDPSHGPMKREFWPLEVQGNPLFWDRGVEGFGSSNPVWSF
ncbi:CoA transferase, partial [Rhodococcus koreensis]